MIKDINVADSYISNMAKYAIVTNLARSLPNVRDGLKPVQRRILYDMDDSMHAYDLSSKKKSARIVGDVMGQYHPHGDSSIYAAMKPMANWFECKVPLIEPYGSFGSIMGGPASSARYTEAYLSKFAMDCVIGKLHSMKSIVSWQDTFDNSSVEPEYLPVTVPLLLVNGAAGIGVGVACNIPTHNLGEVIDATLALIDNPNLNIVLIPDHPLPCDIIDTDWARISETGNGSYRARAILENDTNKRGNPCIRIKSLPVYNSDRVKNQIDDLASSGKIPQIIGIEDYSKSNIDLLVILKKGSDIEFVKSALFKFTDCERSFSIGFEAVDGIERRMMGYTEYLKISIKYFIQNKFRECAALLSNYSTDAHRYEAYIKALESGQIDKIINKIKSSNKGDSELIEYIISIAKITDIQAQFIINAPLKMLSLGYLNRYKDKYNSLMSECNRLNSMMVDNRLIIEAVKSDLIEAKRKYGTPRISRVIKVSDNGIPRGNFRIVVIDNGYIRKLLPTDPINCSKVGRPKFVIDVDNIENLLLFDNKGRVFKLPISKIPIIGKSDPGVDIRGLIRGLTADIVSVMYEPWIKNSTVGKSKGHFYICVLTKNNMIKKINIDDFVSIPLSGVIYSKVNPNDSIISVQIISDSVDVVVYSGHKALRLSGSDIPCYKKNTIGVNAMESNDEIHGMSIIYPNTSDIVVLTNSGMINRFSISGLERGIRNKSGSPVIKLKRGDSLNCIIGCNPNNILHISTTSGIVDVNICDIEYGSSISNGIKVISTKSDIILGCDLQ